MANGEGIRLGSRTFDVATVLGLGGGGMLIAIAIIMGGSPSSFFDLPSVLIVVGGTFSITTICFSLPEMARSLGVVAKTILHVTRDPSEAAIRAITLAEAARKNGVLSLQAKLSEVADQPFLYKGVAMVVDGISGDDTEMLLRRDLQATVQRHDKAASVLRKAAEISPAMGLIGTLIGLVQMLGNLDDPSTIGPSMAVALLTTFYGAILANMLFMPLAAKLERNSSEEALVNQVYMMGVASISRQENPRRLEMMLNSILPPAQRVQYYD